MEHPNVVQFLAFRQSATPTTTATISGHETRIVLEHCNQDDLATYLKGRGSLPVPDRVLINILVDMQAATEYLEEQHILHRDIKPENVFRHRELSHSSEGAGAGADVGPAGSQSQPHAGSATEPAYHHHHHHRVVHKLGDFGLSRKLLTDAKATSQIGTAPWAGPEVTARGGDGYSHECDRFSLGAMVYRCEYGTMLFQGLDAHGEYSDVACRREVKHFAGVLPSAPAGRWAAANEAAVVTAVDSRSLRGAMRHIISDLLKPNIDKRTTCAQLKMQVEALQRPVMVLNVKSSRMMEVHHAQGHAATTMEAVKAVLQAPPYSMGTAEVLLLHPEIPALQTSVRVPESAMKPAVVSGGDGDGGGGGGSGSSGGGGGGGGGFGGADAPAAAFFPLLLLEGAGGIATFGCDGIRSKYPPMPSSSSGGSGEDFEEVRGSSLELALTSDYDFGSECCCHLATTTAWTKRAAELLRDKYAATLDSVRGNVNTLVDARASAKLATEHVVALRKTAKAKFKGLKDEQFVVGPTLYSAIYEGQKDAAPPLYDSEGTQTAGFAYLQKQPTAGVMLPDLKVLEAKAAELAKIASDSAADADTIVIMHDQQRFRNARSALEAHTAAMQAMNALCDQALVGIANGEKLVEQLTEKKDAAVAHKSASGKELEAVHTALFEHLVQFQKRHNEWVESSSLAKEAAALQKTTGAMKDQLLSEAQAAVALAKQQAAAARGAAAASTSVSGAEVAALQQSLQQQTAAAAAGRQRVTTLELELAMSKGKLAEHAQLITEASKELGVKNKLLATQQSELLAHSHTLAEQDSKVAALACERDQMRGEASAARKEADALRESYVSATTQLKEVKAQETVRTDARMQMLEEHDIQRRELDGANRRIQELVSSIQKHARDVALAASTSGALAAAQQQLEAAARGAAAAQVQASAAQAAQATERQRADAASAELATMRAEVGGRPVVSRVPAAGERVILVRGQGQDHKRWIVAGTTPTITVQLNHEADWQSKTRLPFVFAYVIFVDGRSVVVEKVRGPLNELIATT